MPNKISVLKDLFDQYLAQQKMTDNPENLYLPINYIMELGGKRIRPVSAMIGYNVFKDDVGLALPLAYALEIFHNFTLAHDDVMDVAEIRRGKPAMHIAYGLNSAILSGDAMLIYAYRYITACKTSAEKKVQLINLFTDTAIEICEGQQMDMDFEQLNEVALSSYLLMIKLKTAVLLAASLKSGALLAGASDKEGDHFYAFGLNIGLAFQIQDDVLDLYSEAVGFGKKLGGDILQKKKTYLYLKGLELASAEKAGDLIELYNSDNFPNEIKIEKVRAVFDELNVKDHAIGLMNELTENAYDHLNALEIDNSKLTELRRLGEMLLARKS